MICLIGLSGAGKTTLANRLSKEMGFAVFSVGGLERKIALKKGYSDVVEYEKKVGLQKAYVSLFPYVIKELKRVGKQNEGIIVEGVYSPKLFRMMQNAFGKERIILLNIAATRHARLRRLIAREGRKTADAKKNLRALERGKFEVGANEMLKLGKSNTIRNTGTLNETMQKIRLRLRKRMRR